MGIVALQTVLQMKGTSEPSVGFRSNQPPTQEIRRQELQEDAVQAVTLYPLGMSRMCVFYGTLLP